MFRPALLELIHLQYGGSVRACHTAVARLRTFLEPCRGSSYTPARQGEPTAGVLFLSPARRRFMKTESRETP